MHQIKPPASEFEEKIRNLWNEKKLGLNIPLIDLQHLWLVSLILRIEEEMQSQEESVPYERIRETLLDITEFIVEHFDVEERLFIYFSYPLSGAHKDRHDDFIAEMEKRYTECVAGEIDAVKNLVAYLYVWLIDHIVKEDHAYQRYAIENGINLDAAVQKMISEKHVTVKPVQAELYRRIIKGSESPETTNKDTVEKIYGIVSKFRLTINIPIIDIQHLWLLKMAIELDTASYTLAPSRKELFFEKTITRLAEYTREHFATEEMLMKEFSYPDIEMHRQEHTKLIDLVNRRSLQQRAGDVTAASNLARDLKEWIFSHIALEDRRLGTFLSTRQRQVTDFVKSRIQENRLILRKGQVRLYQQVHSIIASRRSGKGEDRTTR